jgi:hypothetical protein
LPTPSKFRTATRARVIELLSCGASRRTAARVAGIEHSTLVKWITKGRDAPEGTLFHRFYLQVMQAEAQPRLRALRVVHDAMPDHPDLAMKFLERREPGFAPGGAHMEPATGPVTVQLTFERPLPLPDPASSDEGGEPPEDEGA